MARLIGRGLLLCILIFSAGAVAAHATPVDFLNFNYLPNLQAVGNFYDGGSKAPNYGVTFSSNFYGLRTTAQGGSGNFAPDPTGSPAIFINATGNASGWLSSANGFSSGINFFYTAAFQQVVTVWSGANGTGTALATITLSPNDASCGAVSYCNWTDVSLTFSGTGKSVTFSGPGNGLGLSDITLGKSSAAIPEPSSIYLLGTGLVGMWGYWSRRLAK